LKIKPQGNSAVYQLYARELNNESYLACFELPAQIFKEDLIDIYVAIIKFVPPHQFFSVRNGYKS
jgi:hypothetical protein